MFYLMVNVKFSRGRHDGTWRDQMSSAPILNTAATEVSGYIHTQARLFPGKELSVHNECEAV